MSKSTIVAMSESEHDKRTEEFQALVVPVIEWLAKQPNYPMVAVVIANDTAQFLSSDMGLYWPTDTEEE